MSVDYHKDQHSPYVREAPFGNFFLSPETLDLTRKVNDLLCEQRSSFLTFVYLKNKVENKTDYKTNFDDPIKAIVTDHTESSHKTGPFEFFKQTQYDGFKNRLWDKPVSTMTVSSKNENESILVLVWSDDAAKRSGRPLDHVSSTPYSNRHSFMNLINQQA